MNERLVRWAGYVGRVLFDGVAPILLPLLLLRTVAARILADPEHTVAAPLYLSGGDPNGQAWFYWWFHRATMLGLPVDHPDVVCAPGGIALGVNFATRVDAWLALPFFHFLPFPQSFNAVAMAVPAVNAWCGWLALRAMRSSPAVALTGGLVLGFSDYALFEVSLGHNANALVGPVLLLLGAWSAVAEGRWGWAPVAAAAGVVTIFAYPPYAVAMLPVAAAFGLVGLATRKQERRAILGGALGVAAIIGLAALRRASELRTLGFANQGKNALRDSWSTLMADSLSWEWLARADSGFNDHHTWIAPALLVGAALAALFGGRRPWGWLAAGAWFWLLSLGVVLLERDGEEIQELRAGGRAFALPLGWAIKAWPTLVGLRPYRFAPLVGGALVFAVASAARSPDHTVGWVRRLLPPLVAAGVFATVLWATLSAGRLRFTTQPWRVSPAVLWLAEQPGDFAIAELPSGSGHAAAALQVVHEKRRSEGHHDVHPEVKHPPTQCYTTSLSRALWVLDRGGALPEDMSPVVSEAVSVGYRYIVVYREAYGKQGVERDKRLRGLFAALRARFGAPVQDDREVAIFEVGAG
ncbi:MAG: hypothetical protein Q8P18_26340 [Pseudomonadota bacterium]|nr:hypothetical protein [Pseudomonadota bacterium]